jgi:hypothetical protein
MLGSERSVLSIGAAEVDGLRFSSCLSLAAPIDRTLRSDPSIPHPPRGLGIPYDPMVRFSGRSLRQNRRKS